MAAVSTRNRGNLAIQEEIWALTVQEGRLLRQAQLGNWEFGRCGYWYKAFMTPLNRAIRARESVFTFHTAGFSSGDMSNMLAAAGINVVNA